MISADTDNELATGKDPDMDAQEEEKQVHTSDAMAIRDHLDDEEQYQSFLAMVTDFKLPKHLARELKDVSQNPRFYPEIHLGCIWVASGYPLGLLDLGSFWVSIWVRDLCV